MASGTAAMTGAGEGPATMAGAGVFGEPWVASERALFLLLVLLADSDAAAVEVGGFAAARDRSSERSVFFVSDAAAATGFAATLETGSERAGAAGRVSCAVLTGTGSSAGPRFLATVGSTTQ